MHTDSVWALAATPSFSHVYSGGRDLSVSVANFSIMDIPFSPYCAAFVYIALPLSVVVSN